LNVGKADKLTSGDVIGLINSNMRNVNVKVGKIELLRNFSFVEVDKEYEQEVIEKLGNAKLKGKKVSLEVASPKPASSRKKSYGSGSQAGRGGGGHRKGGGRRQY